LDGSLDYIFTREAGQLQDRKIVIIFTNGPMTSQPKIQQMIAVKIYLKLSIISIRKIMMFYAS